MNRMLLLIISCSILAASGCGTLSRDYVPSAEKKGYVTFSLQKPGERRHNVPVYQVIDGKTKRLGYLTRGVIEVGNYGSITAAARPGEANFFVGLEDPLAAPLTVTVHENHTNRVTVIYTLRNLYYRASFIVEDPILGTFTSDPDVVEFKWGY